MGRLAKNYIYFIEMLVPGVPDEERPIKIGTARDVRKRLSSLRTGSPYPLQVLGVIGAPPSKEKRLHQLFYQERIKLRKEWFLGSIRLRKYIAENARKLYSTE